MCSRHEYHTVAARIVWDTIRLKYPALEVAVRAIATEFEMRTAANKA